MTRDQSRRAFLKSSSLTAAAVALRGSSSLAQSAQVDAHIDVSPSEPIGTISPEVYSHFIEHLGGVIYDGIWVGEGSKIANVGGIRKDFIDTMKAVKAPAALERLRGDAAESIGGTPEQFATLVRNDSAKYARLANELGIKGT